jgi:hypothetical protein
MNVIGLPGIAGMLVAGGQLDKIRAPGIKPVSERPAAGRGK